jgi:hypothetical protein
MKNSEIKNLKKRIRNRFGSVRRFCSVMEKNHVSINYNTLSNAFTGRLKTEKHLFYLNNVDLILSKWKVEDDSLINETQREFVRIQILKNFKNVRTFSKLYDQFTPVFIHNVISGKKKKLDKRVDSLLSILKHEE